MPEARVKEMQHGVFRAADVEINAWALAFLPRERRLRSHPILFGCAGAKGGRIVNIEVAQGNTSNCRPIAAWYWFRGWNHRGGLPNPAPGREAVGPQRWVCNHRAAAAPAATRIPASFMPEAPIRTLFPKNGNGSPQ